MISRLRGVLVVRDGELVEVATPGGVVYEVEVPLSVVEQLPAVGAEVEIRTLQVVREDRVALYGFVEPGERALFQQLLGVSGVGARMALALLSAYPARRLVRALAERDIAALVQVSGVGKKSAERLVLELADRVGDLELDGVFPEGQAAGGASLDAVRALVALGMSHPEADRAVRAGLEAGVEGVDDLVRRALAQS